MFEILDILGEEFPNHAFGSNKENELFIDGQKISLKWKKFSELENFSSLTQDAKKALYKDFKKVLLKKNLIKVIEKEE